MLQADPDSGAVRRRDGYLPIEDPSPIGEDASGAQIQGIPLFPGHPWQG